MTKPRLSKEPTPMKYLTLLNTRRVGLALSQTVKEMTNMEHLKHLSLTPLMIKTMASLRSLAKSKWLRLTLLRRRELQIESEARNLR